MVTADGFLPLPVHVREDLPPGTLVRFHLVDGSVRPDPRGQPRRPTHEPGCGPRASSVRYGDLVALRGARRSTWARAAWSR